MLQHQFQCDLRHTRYNRVDPSIRWFAVDEIRLDGRLPSLFPLAEKLPKCRFFQSGGACRNELGVRVAFAGAPE